MLSFSDYPNAASAFRFFEEISRIPHISFHTERLADHLEAFAAERGLFCHRDAAGNVLIRKPASPGYETHPGVILQGHTDMVPEHLPGKKIDMTTEPITLLRDGDYLRAEGTTLGGDDGVAIAYALAVLDDNTLAHPELEALFTAEEEVGLLGATALDPAPIRGRRMINLDSDEEGIFTVGCAGGIRVDLRLPACRRACDLPTYRLRISGLIGGHSGAEIHKGRTNGILLLGDILHTLGESGGLRIVSATGGNADNAIPRNAECLFASPVSEELISSICKEFLAKNSRSEPDLLIRVEKAEKAKEAYGEEDTAKFLSLLHELPNGVQAMCREPAGLVETSLNLGVLDTEDGFHTTHSVRSSKEREKCALTERLFSLVRSLGGSSSSHGDYPAWEMRDSSPLCDLMCRIYRETYGKDPTVTVIHAGLECGILSSKLAGLDCISLGPDNYDIHTAEEHLSIPSFARVYDYLLRVLRAL